MSLWGNKDLANNKPKYLDNNHPGNTNVFLVDSSRLANASFGGGKAVSHQGWVKVQPSTGFIKSITVSNSNSSLTYTNTFLSIVGANTVPANASLLVSNGSLSVVVHSPGEGYSSVPTVSASGGNNATLVFTVVPGGRMGRVTSEVLVAMSNCNVSDANSGLPYFTGV